MGRADADLRVILEDVGEQSVDVGHVGVGASRDHNERRCLGRHLRQAAWGSDERAAAVSSSAASRHWPHAACGAMDSLD